jgi:hypothetical protein
MKRLTTLAMVVVAGWALSASAQIAPLDRAREAAARDTAASKGTPEQQQAINMQDSKPAPPPSQAVHGTMVSPAKGSAAKTAPAAAAPAKAVPAKATPAKGKVPTPAEIKKLADEQEKKSTGKPAPEMAKKGETRRDPFVSPIVQVAAGGAPATCTASGKHCLAASDLSLRGIVKSQVGWIAVVETSAHRTYFLHEKDELFNAVVEKITRDAVTIREQTYDNLGKPVPHEVVKKLPA